MDWRQTSGETGLVSWNAVQDAWEMLARYVETDQITPQWKSVAELDAICAGARRPVGEEVISLGRLLRWNGIAWEDCGDAPDEPHHVPLC